MKRVLAVDDDQSRIDLLNDMLGDHEYVVERKMPEEVMHPDFPFCDYVAICLDNDMCIRITDEEKGCPNPTNWGGCDCPTGMTVARWMAFQDRIPRNTPIVLVTNNLIARAFIRIALEGFSKVRNFSHMEFFRGDAHATKTLLEMLK